MTREWYLIPYLANIFCSKTLNYSCIQFNKYYFKIQKLSRRGKKFSQFRIFLGENCQAHTRMPDLELPRHKAQIIEFGLKEAIF